MRRIPLKSEDSGAGAIPEHWPPINLKPTDTARCVRHDVQSEPCEAAVQSCELVGRGLAEL